MLSTGLDHTDKRGVPAVSDLPLCVDLDGTLAYSDTLAEELVALGGGLRALIALLKLPLVGRALFKQHIATLADFDPALLPYNADLVAYLEAQKQTGRYLVLATAANRKTAEAVADHLGIFDEVLASDETRNLKGRTKAQALRERFGYRKFAYAGNDRSDIAVWRDSGGAIVVNASAGLANQVGTIAPIEKIVPGHPKRSLSLLRAMRPHQWFKNLLVFLPIFTANAVGERAAWINAVLLFAAFCATASSIYLINDATDLIADRKHPRKRERPFASGSLSLSTGLIASFILFALGIGIAYDTGALFVILAYAALSIGYSLGLKELPLLDVFLLAALYTIRVYGGGLVTGHELSLWLLGFSGFLFLGLAILKRVAELTALKEKRGSFAHRRGYSTADLRIMELLGCSASFSSSVVLALFVQQQEALSEYASPTLLWGTVPIILFWQCRLWLSTARGYMHDDPIIYSARDWVSWVAGACVLLLMLAAHSIKL